MKVLFVWPNKDQWGFKPMGISLLSAVLRQSGHETALFDTTSIDFGFKDNSEVRRRLKIFKDVDLGAYDLHKRAVPMAGELNRVLEAFRPDVVAVSALSDEVPVGLAATETVKAWNPQALVVWGNKAATMCPAGILAHPGVDYLCRGEGHEFFPRFLACLAAGDDPRDLPNIAYRDATGEIVCNPLAPYFQDLDSLPHFDWSLFDDRHFIKPYDGKAYRGGDHMIYWGCPNICTYCINRSYRRLHGPGAGKFLRHYSVPRIIDELQQLTRDYGIEFYKFHDEDFCIKPLDYFQELVAAYARDVAVPFTVMANARNITPEKAALLKEMGCVSVTVGIETGNERLRREILRRNETREDIIRAVRLLNDLDIRTSAFNMLAIPFETRDTVFETIALNREADVRYPNAGFFFPLPDTELYDVSVREGFYDPNDKKLFSNARPTLNLPGITADELVTLRERFTLYIKFPEALYAYIRRSETDDAAGARLTDLLYALYNEYVFANDGFWDDRGELPAIRARLEAALQGSAA